MDWLVKETSEKNQTIRQIVQSDKVLRKYKIWIQQFGELQI